MTSQNPTHDLLAGRIRLQGGRRPVDPDEAARRIWALVEEALSPSAQQPLPTNPSHAALGFLILQEEDAALDDVRRLVVHDGLQRLLGLQLLLAAARYYAAARGSALASEMAALTSNDFSFSARRLKLALADDAANPAFAAVMQAGSASAVEALKPDDGLGFAGAYLDLSEHLAAACAQIEAEGIATALEERLWPAIKQCGWGIIRANDANTCLVLVRILQSRSAA